MAFAHVGAHCDFDLCKQQDFLPFACPDCKRTFCTLHRERGQHGCSVDLSSLGKLPTCPLCSHTIKVKAKESPDAVVNAHILSGCNAHVLDVEAEEKARKRSKQCGHKGCGNAESFDLIQCDYCQIKHCLKHRHQDDHACPHLQPANKKRGNSAASRLLAKIAQKKKDLTALGKSRPQRASKSSTKMRVKLKAVGDPNIKESDRFYLEVKFPAESMSGRPMKKAPRSVWVNKDWTIGRGLEFISDKFDIENKNHMQNAKKLHLTHATTQAVFPYDVPIQLLQPEISPGDTVQLLYAAA